MNSYIFYNFELYSKQEYYNANKNTFNAYDNFSIKKTYDKIINKYTFSIIESLCMYKIFKNFSFKNLKSNKIPNKFLQLFVISILNINIFLRSFKDEFPVNNEKEYKQLNFLKFAKSFLNYNFCLQKDFLLLNFIYYFKSKLGLIEENKLDKVNKILDKHNNNNKLEHKL